MEISEETLFGIPESCRSGLLGNKFGKLSLCCALCDCWFKSSSFQHIENTNDHIKFDPCVKYIPTLTSVFECNSNVFLFNSLM